VTAEPGSSESLRALTVSPDGHVVAAGDVRADGRTPQAAVVRYTPDGVLDRSFATAGVFRYRAAAASAATDVDMLGGPGYPTGDSRVYVVGRAADHPVLPPPGGAPACSTPRPTGPSRSSP
jgi:hypothetical protein